MATANDPEEVDENSAVANLTDQEMSPYPPELRELLSSLQRDDPSQGQPTPSLMTLGASRPGTVDSDTLKLMLEEANQTFVPTRTFKDIRRSLEKNCHVSICGASGEGKTTMALMLGLKYIAQGYDLIFVNRLDMFDFGSCISSGQKICLIFDDIFGSVGHVTDFTCIQNLCKLLKFHIDKNLMSKQKDKLNTKENGQTLEMNAKERGQIGGMDKKNSDKNKKSTKQLQVIFTAKSYNFKEGMSKMQYQRLFFFNKMSVFDLTLNPERSYSHQEKKTMLQKHRDLHPNIKIEDDIVENIHQVHQESIPFGFPLLCRLFFSCSTFTEKAVDFFKRPLFYLLMELNDILSRRNDQAAALILVLLCEENIKLPELEFPSINTKVDEMFMYVTTFANSASRSGTAAAARSFGGTFLSKGDNLCFAHSSIYEACACALYQFNPTFVLKFCSLDFLHERLKPAHVGESAVVSDYRHHLFVSEEYFHLVVTRMITPMKQGTFLKTVVHPMYRNETFVEKFLEELGSSAMENMAWIQYKERGRGFLYWIVKSKSPKLVQSIEEVLLINFTQEDINEALLAAVECDSLTILKYLVGRLEQNPDEKYTNELLLVSAESSSKDMVTYLLKIGAKVSGSDIKNRNILHLLCIHDRSTVLESIASQTEITEDELHRAKTALDRDKRTPVMLAALHGTLDCFQQMQYEDSDDLSDCNGDHLIHLACEGGNINIVQTVLTSLNINTRGQMGLTPIMQAAYKAHSEILDLLLSKNADRGLVDNNGNALIHYACLGGNTHIVERLVCSENINSQNHNGITPIMAAAFKAHTEVFDFLLSKNANKGLVDGDGYTLLHHACCGSKHIVERLVTTENINTRGQNGLTPIMAAANNAHTEVFDFLLSKDADVGLVYGKGYTLLHLACYGGSKHIVECLVTSENINTRDPSGLTPIMAAANNAHTEVFDFLLSKDADVGLVYGKGYTLLHLACFGGSKHIVERLVTSENINTRDPSGLTPIMAAANNAHTEVFDFLLSKDADVGLVDGDGYTLLHLACFGGSKHIVECLVTSENINSRSQNGSTPIMAAASDAHTEVFDFLLSKAADVGLVDGDGNTLLHLACLGGSKHIVECLVTSENINTRDPSGLTPIMAAANDAHTEVFDFLLSKDADVGLVDGEGDTLLHLACFGGSKHIVERLVTPENINSRGQNGLTPIMAAASDAHTEVFDFLLSKAADVGLVDGDGNTLLHLACLGGSKHIVECLVTPENINSRGQNGSTPIMAAASDAHTEVFDFLLSKDADVGLVDGDGHTLLHLACLGGSKHIVERLVTSENINTRDLSGLTPIMAAANNAHTEVFDFLLSKDADVGLVYGDGDTLLHLACYGGSKHIVERLVTSENINTRGQNGLTPIMAAANDAHTEVFDYLLSKNADVGLVNGDGDTLLHFACFGGSKHIVERLVTPENINSRGQNGSTPIMAAASDAHTEVFDYLLSKNADVGLVDGDGDTLLHLACFGGSKHIVERLVAPENINSRGQNGSTPIMAAASDAHTEVFDYLLSKNADVGLVDGDGDTLLHFACLGGSKHIVERLLTPENINSRGQNGSTPIMAAASDAHTEVFDFLLSKAADVGLVDGDGNTLLHFACFGGSKHIVERLLTPENINSRDQNGSTPIMAAASDAHTEVFDFLLSKDADVGLVNGDGHTLLHLACFGGSKHIVERLVTSENINSRSQNGLTPIMAAANDAHTEVFDFLLSKDADRGLVDGNGDTLLHLACLGGSKYIVERLVTPENINTRGQNGLTPIMAAAKDAHTEVFDYLLSKNADVGLVYGKGYSLLHLACFGGSKHIVERLVTSENINTTGKNGLTPVMAAANNAHTEVFDFLLSKDADRGLVDGNGDTLLHLACLGGSKHIVERLVTSENINTRDQRGLTPIMAAANNAHTEVFDFLLSKDADVGLVDGDGDTLLHLACFGGSKHIVERLVTSENINTRGQHGSTPIMAAANNAHTEVFDFLLSKDAEVGHVDGDGNTLLHHACLGGSKHIVERLVTPENINTSGHYNMTPIMISARRAHTEVFDFLLSKNADRGLVDGNGNTLLHHSNIGGSKHIVESSGS